ncbi:hypothetical protein KOR42_26920 [Thalassoglobus neptunius]|uniref:Uncharacterized protein n=1 Tax=Thalassoglobus neptunius TaxID=1938619 RepID=A0A5C5X081_9PLAN|nr:hypothetical protein KOR42_26920 [Thalassoglobus neptunius]
MRIGRFFYYATTVLPMELERHEDTNTLRSQMVDVLTAEASQASSGPVRRLLLRSACELIESQIFESSVPALARGKRETGDAHENLAVLRVG